jgi:hypothetical protein
VLLFQIFLWCFVAAASEEVAAGLIDIADEASREEDKRGH